MAPTRFPSGVTNVAPANPLGMMGFPDPTRYHVFFDDFDRYDPTDWIINTTETGASSATEALGNDDTGVLIVTNDNADDDADFIRGDCESFLFELGKKLWFKTRFKVSDATQTDVVIGLQIADPSPLDATDGVFFMKDDGDNNIDFYVEKNSTATTATAIGTLVSDTYITLAFYYDGKESIAYYIDDVHVGTSSTTNMPDDEALTISFGIQNGEAAAKVMTIDYIFAAKER